MAKNTMIKAMEKLQKSFHLRKKSFSFSTTSTSSDMEEYNEEDVKEGHFAVVAIDEEDGLTKRFVVPLRCLRNPKFLVLLERAAEEYGFDHGGAVTIPCRPSEVERILAQRWVHDIEIGACYNRFNSSYSHMLES